MRIFRHNGRRAEFASDDLCRPARYIYYDVNENSERYVLPLENQKKRDAHDTISS